MTASCRPLEQAANVPGRLSLDLKPSARRPVRLPVRVLVCAEDTTVMVVGADKEWSAAIAMRTPWPASVREFAVDSHVRGPGSAGFGLRPLGDSIGSAYRALRGTVRLDTGSRFTGTVDVVVSNAKGDTARARGRFDAPAATPGGCP
jgi:hypothetical protein